MYRSSHLTRLAASPTIWRRQAGLCILCATGLLAGCKGEEIVLNLSEPPVLNGSVSRGIGRDGIAPPETLPGVWGSFFVTAFDLAQVARIRDSAGFRANELTYALRLPGHPVFDRSTTVTSSPLRAIRADFAHAAGLTGAGQIISIMDDRPLLDHEQIVGKAVHGQGNFQAGSTPAFHGTAVASVAAGNGVNGGTVGVAPGADLHFGAMNYTGALNWRALAESVDEATALGAIAMNNSWGLTGLTVASGGLSSTFEGRDQQAYIAALHRYAGNGVIVFSMQNDHPIRSASAVAALPLAYPALESSWISVVNAIPTFDETGIRSATLVSTGCHETARFCVSADGQYRVADQRHSGSYSTGSGASFAAPQIAGAIALLAEAFPDLSPTDLRDRLLATADNGFFAPTGSVTFGQGITHGYSEEFGHGFVDLRAALLPIGKAYIAVARGGQIELGTVAIAGGAASGAAVVNALSRVQVATADSLRGTFRVSGAVLAAASGPIDVTDAALAAFTSGPAGQIREARHAALRDIAKPAPPLLLESPSPDAFVGGVAQPFATTPRGLQFDLVRSDPAMAQTVRGMLISRVIPLEFGSLTIGMRRVHAQGSVMGMTAPGHESEILSDMADLRVGLALPLDGQSVLRLENVSGRARGTGAGMIHDFSGIRYDATSLSLNRADVMRRGDVLTLFLRRPLALTDGTARMDLPQTYANGLPGFISADIDIAPAARQIDIGIEYHRPLAAGVTLATGLLWSDHAGHHADQKRMAGLVAVQFSF